MPKTAQLTDAELDELVVKALGGGGGALSASAVREALPRGLRPAQSAVTERLKALARAGRVHAWRGGRSPLYAPRPLAELVRERVSEALAARAHTAAQLRRLRPKGVPETAAASTLRSVLADLVRAGRVFEQPALFPRRSRSYALVPPDALDYLRRPLKKLLKDSLRRGFSEEAVHDALRRFAGGAAPAAGATAAAPSPQTDAERVLAALTELNPQVKAGALVYVPHLRQALAAEIPDPARFDRALLGLLARGVIQLQSHPVPSQLTEDERRAMLPDSRGSFYMAVGLRSTSS